jgi:D,D-heptose 1,7-bisphosphate phosphatase
MKNRAVFLDRDGTVNVEKDYLYRVEDFEFEKNVPQTLKYLYDKGYKLIIISNQSGIARGYFTEEDVEALHKFIASKSIGAGFEITGFYYCPHLEGCACRKPGTEMIERAVIEHDLDISQSFMIGDKEADIIAGKKAGLTTILVGTGYGRETEKKFKGYDHYFDDISGIRSVI